MFASPMACKQSVQKWCTLFFFFPFRGSPLRVPFRVHPNRINPELVKRRKQMAVGQKSKPMVPFPGTHFRTYLSGDWDVHWGETGLLTHGQRSKFPSRHRGGPWLCGLRVADQRRLLGLGRAGGVAHGGSAAVPWTKSAVQMMPEEGGGVFFFELAPRFF